MKKKGFTLIELLAVIIILAIIAIITVPIVNNAITNANEQAFKTNVQSIIRSYEYKELSEEKFLGELQICALDMTNCSLQGTITRDGQDIVVKNVTDGEYCASGSFENLDIVYGSCGEDDETAPELYNFLATKVTSNSIEVTSLFNEKDSFIKTHEYRLLDENGNILVDFINGDTLSGNGNKISKKVFENLSSNTKYYIEVKITNTNDLEVSRLYSNGEAICVTTTTFNPPVITYNSVDWERRKSVTITFDTNTINKYRVLDDNLTPITAWKKSNGSETIDIIKNNYWIQASSSDGVNTLPTISVRIEKIDLDNPTLTVSNINTTWDIEDNIKLKLSDNISGVNAYCINNENNYDTCTWHDILPSLYKEIDYKFELNGTYYAFAKDMASNISNGQEIVIDKVDNSTPTLPNIMASDNKESNAWHNDSFTLSFIGSSSVSEITYYYGTSAYDMNGIGSNVSITDETFGTTYYVKACNAVGLCSGNASYIVKLDKATSITQPNIMASDNKESNAWHNDNFTLSFSGPSSMSGITYYYGTSTSNMTNTGTSAFVIDETNGTTYYVKACNALNVCSAVSSYVVKLDKTTSISIPTITASDNKESNAWHNANFTLSFSGSSSISEITYYYGTNISNMANTGSNVSISSDTASTTYYVKACNALNVCSATSLYVVKLDKATNISIPTITASDNKESNAWHNANFTLSFSGSSSISGITYYYGTSTSNMTNTGSNVSISSDTASTTYYVKACNALNTCSANVSYVAKLEISKPTAPEITGGSTEYSLSRTISILTPSTAISGINHYEYYISIQPMSVAGGSWITGNSVTINTDGAYYVFMKAISNANNESLLSAYQPVYIDTKNPIITPKGSSYTVTEGDSNSIISTYFTTSKNGNAEISNNSCIDTSNSNIIVSNTSTLSVGTHVIKCTTTKSNSKTANAFVTIVVNPKYTGVTNKTYTVGETVTYGGIAFQVVKDNGDSITLITKSNVTTGSYGSSTTWANSNAKTYLNNTWLNNNSTILSDSNNGGLVYDSASASYVRLIKTDELSSSIANASNTPFWTMSVSGSNVYYALANASTSYTNYTVSGNTNGTCYSGTSTSLNSISDPYTSNTLNSGSASTLASPTATSAIISTTYNTTASGSCLSSYSTNSSTTYEDCNCEDRGCDYGDYDCSTKTEVTDYCQGGCTNQVCRTTACAGSACAGSGCAGSACAGSACAGSACAGSKCAGSACAGSKCAGSACAGSGCAGSACAKTTCSKVQCVNEICKASGCTKTGCTASKCTGSKAYTTSCVGTTVRNTSWTYTRSCNMSGTRTLSCTTVGPVVYTVRTETGCNYTTLSKCAGSKCAGSGCIQTGCTSFSCQNYTSLGCACASSTCTGSKCTKTTCTGSTCTGSTCTGSTCTGSTCTGSTCSGSTCTGSRCTRSTCTGSTCAGYTCLGYTSTSCGKHTVTNTKTCQGYRSTCNVCDSCPVTTYTYSASGSTVNWSRYTVSSTNGTLGIRAVITVKKK